MWFCLTWSQLWITKILRSATLSSRLCLRILVWSTVLLKRSNNTFPNTASLPQTQVPSPSPKSPRAAKGQRRYFQSLIQKSDEYYYFCILGHWNALLLSSRQNAAVGNHHHRQNLQRHHCRCSCSWPEAGQGCDHRQGRPWLLHYQNPGCHVGWGHQTSAGNLLFLIFTMLSWTSNKFTGRPRSQDFGQVDQDFRIPGWSCNSQWRGRHWCCCSHCWESWKDLWSSIRRWRHQCAEGDGFEWIFGYVILSLAVSN